MQARSEAIAQRRLQREERHREREREGEERRKREEEEKRERERKEREVLIAKRKEERRLAKQVAWQDSSSLSLPTPHHFILPLLCRGSRRGWSGRGGQQSRRHWLRSTTPNYCFVIEG